MLPKNKERQREEKASNNLFARITVFGSVGIGLLVGIIFGWCASRGETGFTYYGFAVAGFVAGFIIIASYPLVGIFFRYNEYWDQKMTHYQDVRVGILAFVYVTAAAAIVLYMLSGEGAICRWVAMVVGVPIFVSGGIYHFYGK